MEGSALFPDGHHAVLKESSPDLSGDARYITRLAAAKPVKYYFIDFGISTRIPPGSSRRVLGIDGIDQEVPELSMEIPYDPFKVDVFILGNVFKTYLRDVRSFIYILCTMC